MIFMRKINNYGSVERACLTLTNSGGCKILASVATVATVGRIVGQYPTLEEIVRE